MTQSSDGKPGQPISGNDDGELSGRFKRLDEELNRRTGLKVAAERAECDASARSPGLVRALRMSSEFVAGVVAGGLIGWGFDQLVGTKPWGLIVFLLLGFVAGVLNVMRSAGLASGPDDT